MKKRVKEGKAMEGACVGENVVFVYGAVKSRRGLRKKQLQACELTAPSNISHWGRTYGWQLQQTSQELRLSSRA